MTSDPRRSETHADYRGVVVQRDRWRVIICRNNIQWIIQSRGKALTAPWTGQHYCVTREALTRLWRASQPAAAPELDALPTHAHRYHHPEEEKT